MAIYMMSGNGDANNLDYVTRSRFRQEHAEETKVFLFIAIIVFIAGMIFGSAIHDPIYHPTEPHAPVVIQNHR